MLLTTTLACATSWVVSTGAVLGSAGALAKAIAFAGSEAAGALGLEIEGAVVLGTVMDGEGTGAAGADADARAGAVGVA